MKQEEEKLLLKDLCARFAYRVKFEYGNIEGSIDELYDIGYGGEGLKIPIFNHCYGIDEIKPYLRPIHKLTKEELEELEFLTDSDYVDYCNKHHIDYRNLIPKSLALEAPEGMYNIKEK